MRAAIGFFAPLLICLSSLATASAGEFDALTISANIRARHMPFGTVLDPVFASPSSDSITGYTRCGDSALWTGAYLAAESFHYKVTGSPGALDNVKAALRGLTSLADVTGDNRLARCIVPADSPFAAGIESEEANNTIHQSPPYAWVDNTSRDQIVGAFFGLAIAYDFVDDASVKAGASDLATRLIRFIAAHQWSPNDSIANTFLVRPEEIRMLLQVARHLNPAVSVSDPPISLSPDTGVRVDVLANSSYFKFNLDYMSFYNLLRLNDNPADRSAYQVVRTYTAPHGNAFFDVVDRALSGPNSVRDAEIGSLLDQWLERPRRDNYVDLTAVVPVCGSEACDPVPVPLRPPTDFLWQRDPFQLTGGGMGLVETAGIDYILPYWMARYYGAISAIAVQSAAAASDGVAAGEIASLYGTNLASQTAEAGTQPLPISLGGVRLTITDASGTTRIAPLQYVSAAQINFIIPAETTAGRASVTVTGGSATQSASVLVRPVAPTLFSADASGSGAAAATAIVTQAANPSMQSPLPVFACAGGTCQTVPIQLGVDTPVYVTFYGTGIRNRTSRVNVGVSINGIPVPVLYAGPTPNYAGLDQVNVALTLNLRGSGESKVILTVDGQTANTVTIDVR